MIRWCCRSTGLGLGWLYSGSVREGFEDAFVKHRFKRQAEARVE